MGDKPLNEPTGQPVDHRHKGPIYHTLLPEEAKLRQIYKDAGAPYTDRTLTDIAYEIQDVQKERGIKNHTQLAELLVNQLNEPGQLEAIQKKLKNSPNDLTPEKLLTASGVMTSNAPADIHIADTPITTSGTTEQLPADGFTTVTFVHPVDPIVVTSPFGPRPKPTRDGSKNHKADDLGARGGTPVHAAISGIVEKVVHDKYKGDTIAINNGINSAGQSIETIYLDISNTRVKVGDSIEAGQVIADVATHLSRSASTGPHVHFEVKVGGVAVDPEPYLRQSNPVAMKLAELGVPFDQTKTATLMANGPYNSLTEKQAFLPGADAQLARPTQPVPEIPAVILQQQTPVFIPVLRP